MYSHRQDCISSKIHSYYDAETGFYYLQSRYYDPQIGRFINADSYVSTGQGFIGYNMFAYCLNDPVNRIDLYGGISIWYFLMVDSDWGFIHRLVQAHIKSFHKISTEVGLSTYGRADVFDKTSGAVWEIKHKAQDPAGRAALAKAQAELYFRLNSEVTQLGKKDRFEGYFVIKCGDYSFEIRYTTPEDGVILYEVSEIANYDGAYFAQYIPHELRQESDQTFLFNNYNYFPQIDSQDISMAGAAAGVAFMCICLLAATGFFMLA